MSFNIHRFFLRFPTIEFGDFILRDLMLSDKYEYFEMMADPEVVQYLSDEDVPTSVENAEEEIKFWGGLFYRKQSIFWALADKKENKFIGTVGYNNWNPLNNRAEISYDIMKAYWGKGLGTTAVKAAIEFGFKNMELNRIEARTMLENKASHRVLEKLGFKFEGTMRQYRIIRNQPTDIMAFSLLKEDYSKLYSLDDSN